MKFIAVTFLVLFSLCYGQTPNIPSTFIAATLSDGVEVHREGKTRFGFGVIIRDDAGQRGLEFLNITVDQDNNVYDIDFRLELYGGDAPVEYRIRGLTNDPNIHCSKVDIEPGTKLEPFFGWVKYAKDLGQKDIEHLTVELYAAEFGGTKLAVGVDPDNYNKPLVYGRETTGEDIEFKFAAFNTTLTPAEETVFKIPTACQAPKYYKPAN